VDESATGSVNFFGPTTCFRAGVGSRDMHLRMPSSDQGVQAFVWAVVFFLFMWLGALAIDLPGGTSFVVSLVLAAAIFLLVRTRGGDQRKAP
jgi:hypothetical protein